MQPYPPNTTCEFRPPVFPRLTRNSLYLLAAAALIGCSGPGRASDRGTDRYVKKGLDASERAVGPAPKDQGGPAAAPSARPFATVDGAAVYAADLSAMLAEAAGGQALEELVLDRRLEAEARRAGVTVTEEQIRAERELLLDALTGATIARDEDDAARLLERVRSARGLGPKRFAALLRRNALLRSLVAPQVAVTPSALEQARRLRYGERYRVRLIVTTTAREAMDVLKELEQGESFSVVAARRSTDVSAARGGVLDPISPADPEYPAAVRSALRDLTPGKPSMPIALDASYAILMLDEIIPATTPPNTAQAEEALARDVRIQHERLLMNQLARRLLSEANVRVVDPSLDWSWQRREQARQP